MIENYVGLEPNLHDLIERLVDTQEKIMDFNFESLNLVRKTDNLINTLIATCSNSNIEKAESLLYKTNKQPLIQILSTQITDNAKRSKSLLRKLALAATSKRSTDLLRHEFQVALQNLCMSLDILYQELFLSSNLPLFDRINFIEIKSDIK